MVVGAAVGVAPASEVARARAAEVGVGVRAVPGSTGLVTM